MLVAGPDELGELAAARIDAGSELVAGSLSRCLQTLGHRAGPEGVGLLDDLSNCARGLERTHWVSVSRYVLSRPKDACSYEVFFGNECDTPVPDRHYYSRIVCW